MIYLSLLLALFFYGTCKRLLTMTSLIPRDLSSFVLFFPLSFTSQFHETERSGRRKEMNEPKRGEKKVSDLESVSQLDLGPEPRNGAECKPRKKDPHSLLSY